MCARRDSALSRQPRLCGALHAFCGSRCHCCARHVVASPTCCVCRRRAAAPGACRCTPPAFPKIFASAQTAARSSLQFCSRFALDACFFLSISHRLMPFAQNLASKKIRLPLTFSATCSITLFPAIAPDDAPAFLKLIPGFASDDAPAPPLCLQVAFGEPSKASTAQTICVSYTKGLTDEQVCALNKTKQSQSSCLFRRCPVSLPHRPPDIFCMCRSSASRRPSGAKLLLRVAKRRECCELSRR